MRSTSANATGNHREQPCDHSSYGPDQPQGIDEEHEGLGSNLDHGKQQPEDAEQLQDSCPDKQLVAGQCRAEERVEGGGHKPRLVPDHLEGRDQHIDEGIPDRQCRIPEVEQPFIGNELIRRLRQDADEVDDDRRQARCQLLQDGTDPVGIGRQGIQDRVGCLDDGRCHQGCELVGILLEEEADEGQFIGGTPGNRGCLIGGRQPQGLDLLPGTSRYLSRPD